MAEPDHSSDDETFFIVHSSQSRGRNMLQGYQFEPKKADFPQMRSSEEEIDIEPSRLNIELRQ